jgi:hypothetical protein
VEGCLISLSRFTGLLCHPLPEWEGQGARNRLIFLPVQSPPPCRPPDPRSPADPPREALQALWDDGELFRPERPNHHRSLDDLPSEGRRL